MYGVRDRKLTKFTTTHAQVATAHKDRLSLQIFVTIFWNDIFLCKKRQREGNLEKAREEKRRRSAGESSTEIAESGAASHEDDVNDMADLLDVSIHELDTDNEDIDPSFDLDASMKSDSEHMTERFCEDWVSHLDRDDLVSLGLFQLASHLNLGETKAAELASAMINKSDKTIREWRTHFFQNEGEIPESTQGKYQRSGIVWSREDLNKTATKYIRLFLEAPT